MEITPEKSEIYGLIGKNIGYSFSKNYFLKKFEHEKIEKADYLNFDIEDLSTVKQLWLHESRLKGFNVTIPFKSEIIPLLDSVSEEAKKIGAVNCVVINHERQTIGYNTDCIGFEKSLITLLQPMDKQALILGNGGAAKAVKYVLEKLQIAFHIVSRNPTSEQLSYEALTIDKLKEFNLIINTTPLGTYPKVNECPPIPLEGITKQHLVYDLIYNPEKTILLKHAEKKGARIKNGYEMLVLQAEAGWKLWQSHK
jgi:shikimate dehydrogenase